MGTDVIDLTSEDSTEKKGNNRAQSNQANPDVKSREKTAILKLSGFDQSMKENKFLQFCNLGDKKEPEGGCSGPILNPTMLESSKAEPAGRSVTPVLFERKEKEPKMEISSNDETYKEEKGKFDQSRKKRPLFRPSTSNARREVSKETNTSYDDTSSNCEISEMNIVGSVTKKEENKTTKENCVSEIEVKVECGTQFEIEAKYRKEKIEKPESGKEERTDTILENDKSNDLNNSDEEVFDSILNTRRKYGKKRTLSLLKHRAKRSKGVQYAEENSSQAKENEVHKLSCSHCDSLFLALSALEKTRDVPKFLPEWSGSEVIQIKNLDLQSSFEVAVADLHKSVTLNCLWCADLQCGVQFLKCRTCSKTNKGGNPAGIIGARILVAAEGCTDFAQGQTWLLSSAVKTT